ncbi:2412_t:CDS:2, partial [Cetraspora pellucida]
QQNLLLENNPLNMVEARCLPTLKYVSTLLNLIPQYFALEGANAGDFDDAIKVEIMKGKMAEKYAPVLAQNNFVNPPVNIDSPDIIRAWLNEKYQRETIETKNSAIQRLSQERFQSYDTPDTYEARICPLILGIANNDAYVLGTLKTHLSEDRELYSWMRNENIGAIDEFFTILKNMWLERSSLNEGQNFDQAQPKKKLLAKQDDSIISQPVFSSYDEMQKSFQAMMEKQKIESKAEIEKQKAEIEKLKAKFETKMTQQSKKSRPPVLPKDYEQMQEFYKGQAFPPPIPTKPERLHSSNQNARIDRIESKVDKIGQMTSQFGTMMLDNKKPVAKSNSTYRYFSPLIPSQSQYASPDSDNNENEEGRYSEEENKWHALSQLEKKTGTEFSQPETYDELLLKLSPAMRKMCQSHIVQEKESKSDEWFSSLQYLHCNINDLLITNSFLDSASEFGGVNDVTINILRWKANKPSDFAIKGNSKHISESLEWYTDMPISVKDKDGKIVHGVLDPSKNQFQMKLHGKTYTIPTFSKPPGVSEPEQRTSDMHN